MVIRRRRAPGELVIEQTRDFARVEAILAEAAMSSEGLTWPAGCYLMACVGDETVGVVGVETLVDASLLRSLAVAAAMRGRGIGRALVAAARTAAHTRGATRLYTLVCRPTSIFARSGFSPVATEELITVMRGTFTADRVASNPEMLGRMTALGLDISRDGVITR